MLQSDAAQVLGPVTCLINANRELCNPCGAILQIHRALKPLKLEDFSHYGRKIEAGIVDFGYAKL